MTTFADLLHPADRAQLAALGAPPANGELAESARAAAADSSGSGRVAWALVVHVLDQSENTSEAREALAAMVEDDGLRTVALACLAALSGGATGTS